MGQIDLNALAHEVAVLKNNFKTYTVGNSYNGVALTITSAAAGYSCVYGLLMPQKTITGENLCYINFRSTYNAVTPLTHAISGIVFKNIAAAGIRGSQPILGGNGTGNVFQTCTAIPNTGNIYEDHQGGAYGETLVSTWLLLESWPTFADKI